MRSSSSRETSGTAVLSSAERSSAASWPVIRSAPAGSSCTSAAIEFSVLNRKCGCTRDSIEASCASAATRRASASSRSFVRSASVASSSRLRIISYAVMKRPMVSVATMVIRKLPPNHRANSRRGTRPAATSALIAAALPARPSAAITIETATQLSGKTKRPKIHGAMRGIAVPSSAAMQQENTIEIPKSRRITSNGVPSVAPPKAKVTAIDAMTFPARMRPQYAAVSALILFVASDAAEPLALRNLAGGEPGLRFRRLARRRRRLDQPIEILARLLRVAQPAVAFGKPEQQLALGVIAERVEVRRLQREHVLVILDAGLEQRARHRWRHVARRLQQQGAAGNPHTDAVWL